MNLNICVASGLANARTVMEQVKNGEKEYHLIRSWHAAADVSWVAASRQDPATEPKL